MIPPQRKNFGTITVRLVLDHSDCTQSIARLSAGWSEQKFYKIKLIYLPLRVTISATNTKDYHRV
ncbi:MAG: hypothetical protein CBC79_04510 [Gammaproteobacteria bacterium TMED119]|nr:MAG: hypothetical protein CBC79_04510 [Gammaproteobacteria bacterium TMED119]